ncbi:MAG: PAS domain S-box protein [Gammaproteobacteria bacterium]|nr:PAS domain S-box protein [Gammaproteobacteria bacterium]MCW8909000.1 PAS domain S-box protein [Gammaproteobacteria bacterium]
MKLQIAHKISILSISLVLITTIILSWIFYNQSTAILINNALDEINDSIYNEGLKLEEHIFAQREDTLFLSQLPDIKALALNPDGLSSEIEHHAKDIFSAYLKTKTDYTQMRLIDNHGQELIRVDNINNEIKITPDAQLQNKSSHDYVKKSLLLGSGEIYLSEINLNREQGKVSLPHQVVLRSATPVITKNNKAAGLIIINAEIGNELLKIQRAIEKTNQKIFITNDHGYYLSHPDKKRTFGFDLGHQYRIQEDFPLISKFFFPGNKDNHIILHPEKNNSDHISIFTKIHFDRINPQRFITVGIQKSYNEILINELNVLYATLKTATAITGLSLLIAILFSLRITRPLQQITQAVSRLSNNEANESLLPLNQKDEIGLLARTFKSMSEQTHEAQKNLRELNNNLETLIDERTKQLSDSKYMLQTVMDTIPVRVFWKDTDGKYLGCNSLFAKDSGFDDARLIINKNDYDMPWKGQADQYRSDDREVTESGTSKLHLQEPQTTPDGKTIWLETNKVPLSDANNNIIGILGTYQDITERKLNELNLLESRSRQQAILQNMIDGVISITQKGIVQSFNHAAETIFGYTPDEVIGKNVSILMPEPYHSAHDSYLNNYIETGDQQIIGIGREVEGLRKDGSTFPLDLAVSEIEAGKERVFIGIVRDITERKRIDQIKNEFISTVSHELRTPLTSIRGSLGLITGGAVGKISPQASEMLSIASNNTERLLMLINDILDIQKIESGVISFKFKNIELAPFLKQAIKDNAAYATQFHVNFIITKFVDNAFIFADPDRLMQVMSNLLSNAAKFSPANNNVEISSAIHGDTIRISVTDHGSGIAEEFQPKLFEKFTQSDSSDSRQKEGTGLGLSITKTIVEAHGGRIGYITKQGIGSTFYIDLPKLTAIDSITDALQSKQLASAHTPCILIVEDDPDVAALIQRMLAESGYDSDIAYSADQARKLLAERGDDYRLMTLDVVLPDEDGISLLNSLRKDTAYRDLPIIIISATADEAKNSIEAVAIEVVDWLSKPIDHNRLLDVINNASRKCSVIKILHVEDEDDVHRIVSVMLKDHCTLDRAKTFAEAKDKIINLDYDLVLLDIGLPDGSGLDLLEIIENNLQPPQVIIFSAQDVTREYADKVNAVLVKSHTSNEKLLEIIKQVIN